MYNPGYGHVGGGGGSRNCMFFTKIGACRHGEGCTKLHVRPTTSPTVLFPMMYPNPRAVTVSDTAAASVEFDKAYLQKHLEHFYKNVWRTFMDYGRIRELRVVSNLGDHLLGNVYVCFEDPAAAAKVVADLTAPDELHAKLMDDIIVLPELCPVTNFAEACCKEDLEGHCSRGEQCNYLHILKVSRKLLEKLEREQNKAWKKREHHGRKRSRSRSASQESKKED